MCCGLPCSNADCKGKKTAFMISDELKTSWICSLYLLKKSKESKLLTL